MSLSIKNAETVRLARQVADRTGETVTGAISVALRERLDRLQSEPGALAHRMLAIGLDCAAHLDERSRVIDHGALLYGDDGLPR